MQHRDAGIDQRQQHRDLECPLEPRCVQAREQESRGERFGADLVVVAHHRYIEENGRQHAERSAERARDQRFATRREMTDAEQHRGNGRDVVARVGDAGLQPVVAQRLRGEVRLDAIAEGEQAPEDEHDVDEVQIAHRQRQELLDEIVAVEQQRAGGDDHAERTDQLRPAEQAVDHLARCRAHHRHDDDDQQQVGDLEQEPAAAEQQLEEGTVVVSLRDARQLEADHQHRAPHQHADEHAEQPAPRPGRQEEFDEFAPGGIAAGDHGGFEDETRQQVAFEEIVQSASRLCMNCPHPNPPPLRGGGSTNLPLIPADPAARTARSDVRDRDTAARSRCAHRPSALRRRACRCCSSSGCTWN